MSKVTFPGTGHAYSDDGSTDRDMLNGGHAEWLLPMLQESVDTTRSAIDASTSASQSKADAAASALSARQDAGTAQTARQDAQNSATQAKNWAATVNVPQLPGKGGRALFAKPDESGSEWLRAVRSGGGAQQGDNQIYVGWDGQRVRVQVDATDLGSITLAADCVGDVVFSASAAGRTRGLRCNGAAISRTAYAALFAKIGTTYGGGDGVSTFNVPDLRGEFIRVWDDGRGVDPGRGVGSWQDSLFGYHAHGASCDVQGVHAHGGGTGGVGDHAHPYSVPPPATDPDGQGAAAGQSWLDLTKYATSTTGGGGAHNHSIPADGAHAHNITVAGAGGNETRPRNVALPAWILY
ncbi:putative Phage tail collar domain-containing protein [Paraburkholderia tropica]